VALSRSSRRACLLISFAQRRSAPGKLIHMITELVANAVLMGLILALPTGPVGILCLRRTLVGGRRAGLVSGAGACLADLVYVVVVRVGLTPVQQLISARRFALQMLAGSIVVGAGYRIIVRQPAGQAVAQVGNLRHAPRFARAINAEPSRHAGLFTSAFLLSVTNPTLLLSIPALFAVMHFPASPNVLTVLMSVLSIFAGSMAWWSTVTSFLDRSSANISDQAIRRASTLAGVALIVLGLISISSLMV